MTKICISVCTRQRPEMLEKCVMSLVREMHGGIEGDRLIVVENDHLPHAAPFMEQLKAEHTELDITYLHESNLGIPVARNRCLDFALESGCDWLAFIDDDEVAEEGWLVNHRRAADELGFDVLTGPVYQVLSASPPFWMKAPRLKPRKRGQSRDTAATNNTMLSLAFLREKGQGLRFDESFKFTGGSDVDFFYRLSDRGGRICWVDDAIVKEVVPAERMTVGWQMQRASRVQANNFNIHTKRKGLFYGFVRTLPKVIGRGLMGLGLMGSSVFFLPLGTNRAGYVFVSGLQSIAGSYGAVKGIFGWKPQVYRKVTG